VGLNEWKIECIGLKSSKVELFVVTLKTPIAGVEFSGYSIDWRQDKPFTYE
jgi:hypothetical protein